MNINIVGGDPALVQRLMNDFRISGHSVCNDCESTNPNTFDLTIRGCDTAQETTLRDLVTRLDSTDLSGCKHNPVTLQFDAERYCITLPSARALLHLISLHLMQVYAACLTTEDQQRFNTALNEALQNALIHGNLEISSTLRDQGDWEGYEALICKRLQEQAFIQRTIRIEAHCDKHRLSVTVEDDGPGFDPAQLPDPRAADALLRPSGRGITMIRFAMDEVQWNARGNRIEMTKHLDAA